MAPLTRRDLIQLGLASSVGWSPGVGARTNTDSASVHEQLLDLAALQEERRRARFAAVKSKADLELLQKELRQTLLQFLGGFPERKEVPPARVVATIDAGDYLVEKLVYQSFPGYFVSALLYNCTFRDFLYSDSWCRSGARSDT
jgi:hypothetical protein